MSTSHVQECLLRARETYERRPSAALQQDSAALAVWKGGLATALVHEALPGLRTDMPAPLGGTGDAPSPGWYFRAGAASCLATSIAMQAAVRGIALTRVEVLARSESDARGMLGNPDVVVGPQRFWLDVSIEGDATDDALRELVAAANAVSPMPNGLRNALDTEIQVRVPASQPA